MKPSGSVIPSLLVLACLVVSSTATGQPLNSAYSTTAGTSQPADTSRDAGAIQKLLIRCDDIGMCHSVNLAAEELAKSGIRFSASVMFVCPWYREAVAILKQYPDVAVGVHLALNAEWTNYKWGPVLGGSAVPSLVDSNGYFFGTPAGFRANGPKTDEVEKELRAQIERAIHSGLDIKYLDMHMSTIDGNPEYLAIVDSLAKEYHLVVSRSLGEKDVEPMYSEPIDRKESVLLERLTQLSSDSVNLLVCHIAVDSRESEALIDSNPGGLPEMSRNRQAELNALLSTKFAETIKAKGIKLVTYAVLAGSCGSKCGSK